MMTGMAEYIERQDAIEAAKHAWAKNLEPSQYIKAIPSADVATVRHGDWMEWFPGDCALIMTGEEMLYRCSCCDVKYSDAEGYKYCPNCGARMDLGEA